MIISALATRCWSLRYSRERANMAICNTCRGDLVRSWASILEELIYATGGHIAFQSIFEQVIPDTPNPQLDGLKLARWGQKGVLQREAEGSPSAPDAGRCMLTNSV